MATGLGVGRTIPSSAAAREGLSPSRMKRNHILQQDPRKFATILWGSAGIALKVTGVT